MRRVRRASAPWIGSIVVHGAIVAAAMQCRGDRAASRPDAVVVVEVIDEEAPAAVSAAAVVVADEGGGGGGGDGAPREPAPPSVTAPPRTPRTPTRPRVVPAQREVDDEATRPAAVSSASPRIAARLPAPTGDPQGTGGGSGQGSGSGSGRGAGTGRGLGGGARAPARAAPHARAAPSKARPPRLVYPRRDRDARPGEVFVVLLTVDEKGYVVGVRLQQGVNPDRDAKALDAVWRFHYDPALDRAGRPIRTKVVQRFMVE